MLRLSCGRGEDATQKEGERKKRKEKAHTHTHSLKKGASKRSVRVLSWAPLGRKREVNQSRQKHKKMKQKKQEKKKKRKKIQSRKMVKCAIVLG